jgi:hypothetical protein
MQKSKVRKLNLNRETLQQLNPSQVERAAGGVTIPFHSCAQLCNTQTADQTSCGPAC